MGGATVSVLAGGVLLWGGAWAVVRGGTAVALRSGVRPWIVGLTVVAFGTSAPEIVVTAVAALNQSGDMAVGNAIGSNACNLGLVLGTVLVLGGRMGGGTGKHWDALRLLGSLGALGWVLRDGSVDRTDGLGLLALYLVALIAELMKGGDSGREKPSGQRPIVGILHLVLGIACVAAGAKLLVDGAVGVAERWSVDQGMIGLTVVALGTSLPELAVCLAAARAGRDSDSALGLGLGTLWGSNVLNALLVPGLAAVLAPMHVREETLVEPLAIVALLSVAGIIAASLGRGRLAGAGLLVMYAVFVFRAF